MSGARKADPQKLQTFDKMHRWNGSKFRSSSSQHFILRTKASLAQTTTKQYSNKQQMKNKSTVSGRIKSRCLGYIGGRKP